MIHISDIRDKAFAVKDRKKYAKENCDDIRFIERDTFIVRVNIFENGEVNYD